MGALVSVLAVGFGARMAASALSFKQLIDGESDNRAPQFSTEEMQNIPIARGGDLQRGTLINKFARDSFNIAYREPNPDLRHINPEAVLPNGFAEAYQRLRGENFLWVTPGGSAPLAKLDPNLLQGTVFPAPQQFLPRAELKPQERWTSSFLPATQSSAIPHQSKRATGLGWLLNGPSPLV